MSNNDACFTVFGLDGDNAGNDAKHVPRRIAELVYAFASFLFCQAPLREERLSQLSGDPAQPVRLVNQLVSGVQKEISSSNVRKVTIAFSALSIVLENKVDDRA